ncbi:MAG TPA: hypothetical protein VED01_02265 [Burkholderiales bacterium]|nr:hypothetical protein [Burkholderiales bacterium]
MDWKIFTRKIEVDGGVQLRWYWRKPVSEGREESPVGFTSRTQCEGDARKHGYTANTAQAERSGEG